MVLSTPFDHFYTHISYDFPLSDDAEPEESAHGWT
jgi:hypothetical protein